MVIYQAVGQIDNRLSELDSLMQQIGSVWNDRVAEHVSEELLAGVVSQCNAFSGELHSIASILMMRRSEMERLADVSQ